MNSIEELERIDNYQYLSDREKQSIVNHFKTETLLMFNSFNGQKPQEIEQTVREYIESIIKAEYIDARIIDIAITGSRCRGLEHEGSDLDVVIEYSGDIREDDFFNLLHKSEFKIEDIPVDINPITKNKSEDMGVYLLKAEDYLKKIAEKPKVKEQKLKSIFSICMCSECIYFENTSGLDAEALCKAYGECEKPFVEMKEFGKRIDIGEFADIQQSEKIAFSVEFDADNDEITLFDGSDFSYKKLQEYVEALRKQNDLSEPDFDLRLLPDKLQPADMQEYGYTWDGILPLTKERATELFDSDVTVYKLHPDNTETAVENKILDIKQYDGMFGIEKRDWLIYLRDKIELMSEADREGLINGVESGFDSGYDVATEDVAIYHCLTDKVQLPKKLTEHSTGVEPVDKKGFGYEQPFRVIEKAHYNGQDLFLLESEAPEYLDGNVITDENGNIIMENVRNGFTEYVEYREDLVDRYDLRHPISFKSDSGVDIELKQYFKMPYNLKFVFNDICEIYIGKVGNLEDRIILKTSDNDYIYSAEFNKDYDDGKIHLTNNLDTDEYEFEILGNSERINDLEAAYPFEPIAATYEDIKQLLLSDYVEQNREIADEVYISVGDSSNRDYFDSPKEIYYGTLADLPKELLNAKVIDKSQIVASSFPERNGSWNLVIECIPQKEMTYALEDIEQLISNRKQTHYGIYADISDAVSDVPTDKLAEYYKEKLGESRLRDFLEEEISKMEMLKDKNKSKTNNKIYEEYER